MSNNTRAGGASNVRLELDWGLRVWCQITGHLLGVRLEMILSTVAHAFKRLNSLWVITAIIRIEEKT